MNKDALRHNLPTPLTSFVGREGEVRAVEQLVSTRRLVTLAGVGGAGKTRLAMQVGSDVMGRFPDGVWFADLGAITDGSLVPRQIATAVGLMVEPGGDQVAALARQLGQRHMLLVLDTCEHLLTTAAELVETLLRGSPALSVLTTSREPLGVEGETVWRIPSLNPYEAVQLFNDRAGLALPEFEPASARPDIDAICDRVDRIPLAIELAAAWVRVLSPAQIAAGLGGNLQLLSGGPRTTIPRHQTLQASMAWSYDLLAEAERVLFRRLGVFAGTFTLDTVAAVCSDDGTDEVTNGAAEDHDPLADPLQVLRSLLDKSLVIIREVQGENRFLLLDIIRQYAQDQLAAAGETETVRDRHLNHFLQLAEAAEPGLDTDQDRWREHLDSHHDNIAAALRWGLAEVGPRAERGRRLAAAMARQWFLRGQTVEGFQFLHRAIELAPAERSAVQGRLWAGTAMLAMVSGRRDLVSEAAARGADLAAESGDQATLARCQTLAAFPIFFIDFARCQELCVAARAAAEAAGDAFARDWAGALEGYSLQTRNRHDEAMAAARRAFEGSAPRGDRFCAAFARGVEIYVAMVTGEIRRAVAAGREAVEIARPLGDYFAAGTNTVNAAEVTALSGDIETARQMVEPIVRSLSTAPEADVVGFMVSYGYLELWDGNTESALTWFERGIRPGPDEDLDWTAGRCLPGLIAALRRLSRTSEATQWADRAVAIEKRFCAPYELSNVLDEQARLLSAEDPDRARNLHHEALALRVTHHLRTCLPDSLDALAVLDASAGRHADAARLLASAQAARDDLGYPRPSADRPAYEELLTSLRTEMGDEAFETAWQQGTERSLDDTVTAVSRGRGPRDRPATGWDSLTPTELEVVRLVSDGLSNPDIAAQLYMSRSTVKAHLSHVYAKLAVGNRTQLARLAGKPTDD